MSKRHLGAQPTAAAMAAKAAQWRLELVPGSYSTEVRRCAAQRCAALR